MLSIGTVDVHCDERFSQILRIAAWVRWYCQSILSFPGAVSVTVASFKRMVSTLGSTPSNAKPFANASPSLICESVICPAMTCRAAFFSLFLARCERNAHLVMSILSFPKPPSHFLDWKSLRQSTKSIHFRCLKSWNPKIMALWNSLKFTSIHKIWSSFESFPMIISYNIAPWGSHCDRKPRRLSTRPLPMDTSVALGAWSLTLIRTILDSHGPRNSWEIHGDINKSLLIDGIWWRYDGEWWGYNLIASKIIKDYGDYGFQSRCSLLN